MTNQLTTEIRQVGDLVIASIKGAATSRENRTRPDQGSTSASTTQTQIENERVASSLTSAVRSIDQRSDGGHIRNATEDGQLTRRTALTRVAALSVGLAVGVTTLPAAASAQASGTQIGWRFCFKCSAMFYNGYAYKNQYGLCPYDYTWGHTAAGYDFAIPVWAYT